MRILLAGAAAASFAFAATPAFAQYGGSPAEQVEDAPAEADMAPAPEDEAMPADEAGDMLAPDVDQDVDVDADADTDLDTDPGNMAGKVEGAEGEDYALADVNIDAGIADVDADVDADIDADTGADMDAGEAQPPVPDEAAVEGDEATDEGAPAEESATWQGEDERAYCRRSDGTTGLIVGGGAGALVGREIGRDGRHHRRRGRGGGTTGTIIGGIIGAVVGSAIERGASEQNCR